MFGIGGTDARVCSGGRSTDSSVLELIMFARLLVAVVFVAASSDAFAFNDGPLRHLCRKTGFGWSDGYHAPRPCDNCGCGTHLENVDGMYYQMPPMDQPRYYAPQPEPALAPTPPVSPGVDAIEPQPSALVPPRAPSPAPAPPLPTAPQDLEPPQPMLTPPAQFSVNRARMIRRLPATSTYDREAHRYSAPARTW
jgi:hypothetical protein